MLCLLLPVMPLLQGYLVAPYLSLQQLEVLSSARAFIAGASNTLFLHKRHLYHVLVQARLYFALVQARLYHVLVQAGQALPRASAGKALPRTSAGKATTC